MLQVVAHPFNTGDCARDFLNRAGAIDRGVQPPKMIFNNRSSGETEPMPIFALDVSPISGGQEAAR
jgi:hypothetical protein